MDELFVCSMGAPNGRANIVNETALTGLGSTGNLRVAVYSHAFNLDQLVFAIPFFSWLQESI